jgi:hypothetical protein
MTTSTSFFRAYSWLAAPFGQEREKPVKLFNRYMSSEATDEHFTASPLLDQEVSLKIARTMHKSSIHKCNTI